jgi:hypothetical protein
MILCNARIYQFCVSLLGCYTFLKALTRIYNIDWTRRVWAYGYSKVLSSMTSRLLRLTELSSCECLQRLTMQMYVSLPCFTAAVLRLADVESKPHVWLSLAKLHYYSRCTNFTKKYYFTYFIDFHYPLAPFYFLSRFLIVLEIWRLCSSALDII